ncbi:uncharacterized protein LOC107801517 [Nicotiana tabacum]|uniref:Uncharacterized protein LOC107801517 n=1 Tax=Nicotiana tabacum TaxID=4097 RepID=A0AC58USM6_TOBAC
MAEIISDGEDRISELPVHIIHDILRRINVGIYGAKEEARTCVLSKTWNSIWRTRPNVIIQSIHRSFYKNLENFVKFVDDSLRTYAEQKLSIETLCLMHLDCPQELASHVDRWFNLALKLHVRYLCIDASMFGSTYYSIPDSVYAVNNTLTVLSLANCNIEIDNSTNKLQRLISTCPLIRDLRLTDCKGFQNFHVTAGLINLERLELIWCRELIKVKIGAPNLKNFVFVGVPLHKYPKTREPEPMPCTIDILDGKSLKSLSLEATTMTDQEFEYQLSKFSALKFLKLKGCYVMKNMKIVSEKLEIFDLSDHRGNLEQVNMVAPNLIEFNFSSGKTCMPFSTMDPSSLERANINFYAKSCDSYDFGDVDTSLYNNLLNFIQKFNYSKGLILVIRCEEEFLIYEDSREIMIPPAQKLELLVKNPSMRLPSFVNDIMSSRPKIASVVHGIDCKIPQVFHESATTYTKKQYGRLKEVTNHKGVVADENGETSTFCTWLKSTSLIERITTFSFKWV